MNTDDNELMLARKTLMTPEQRQAELALAEKLTAIEYAQTARIAAQEGYRERHAAPVLAGNRHERRQAAKLARARG